MLGHIELINWKINAFVDQLCDVTSVTWFGKLYTTWTLEHQDISTQKILYITLYISATIVPYLSYMHM